MTKKTIEITEANRDSSQTNIRTSTVFTDELSNPLTLDKTYNEASILHWEII